MFELIRSLESDMIILIRTFHHGHLVASIQGNQNIYIYVITSPTIIMSAHSAIVPGEA